MPLAKNKTRANKPKKIVESNYKARLEEQAAALLNPSMGPAETDVQANMTSQQKQWRQDLLNEIEQSNKPSTINPEIVADNSAATNAVNSAIKARLKLKKIKKHRFFWLPLLGIVLYSSIFILRLDKYIPQVSTYFPWPAAYVNGQVVWLDEVKNEAKVISLLDSRENSESYALDHLVEEKLISSKFDEYKLSISAQQVNEQLNSLSQEFGSPTAFFDYIRTTYSMEPDNFINRILKPYLRRLSIQDYLNNDPRASFDAETEARLIKNKITDQQLTFEQAASQFSDDYISAKQNGSLGWFTWGTMLPEFEATLRNLKPGEISEPIKTGYGYHLIRLDELRGEIPTNGNSDETSGVLASHIYFRIVDFESWLANILGQANLITLVPIKG